ncbi:MAG: hypothetical protein OEV23_07600 [Gallionella sp.]|nr:hypothetical protein [Gallionella sp.]
MKISTETLGLAGEYAVAAELCRRGVYCQLTLGNRKKTDLLVETKDSLFRVSVKAKQTKSWPKVSGIWQKGDLLVLVDYKDKAATEAPDFYVLDVAAWKKVVTLINKGDPRAKLNSENTLVWPGANGEKDIWKGCEVLVEDVKKFKDAWPEFSAH